MKKKDPNAWRPSIQLDKLLLNGQDWDEAKPAIQSWARLQIYKAASTICERKERKERLAMLQKIPETIRPKVEAEVIRLWELRRKR